MIISVEINQATADRANQCYKALCNKRQDLEFVAFFDAQRQMIAIIPGKSALTLEFLEQFKNTPRYFPLDHPIKPAVCELIPDKSFTLKPLIIGAHGQTELKITYL